MSPRAQVSVFSQRTFRSLRRRNYRLYFIGQVISLTGTWMQNVAQAWFVVELTHSPLAVGVLAVCQFGPYGLLGLLGGTVADRVNQRRLLIGTQSAFLLSATSLAVLALTGHAAVWEIYLLAAINGCVLVLDTPVRQSFTIQMVGRAELPNAIALNSSIFNASRIVGPAVAGAVIAVAGVALCFLFNAASFLAVIAALALMRESELFSVGRDDGRANVFRGAGEGLRFAWHAPGVRTVLVMMLVISTIGINFNVLLPVLTTRTLHSGPEVFGMISALFGLGALAGALASAALGRASARTLLTGALLFSLAELALAPLHTVWAVAAVLVVTGVAFSLYASQSNATLQLATPDRLRGRVLGIYGYVFFGTAPLGGLLAGWLAQTGGTQLAFLVAGGAGRVAAAYGAAEMRNGRAPDTALTPGGLHAA
ncbi:MAG TPA: MFS transporter [Candidatus Dormibacteraeota bacterium]|nr:MFS transporter [Candidatus Dormibacteraeota bacterium]